MKISAQGRYSVRILIDLATHQNDYVSISELSKRQGVSIKYLEKIMRTLVKGKIVESLMGPNGGYKLSKPANKCTIAEILTLTGDTPNLAPCQNSDKTCPNAKKCSTIGYWDTLQKLIFENLNKITLQDLIDKTY
ncbi:MAG: Rrf2 family transcriptional regulator [Clostridia bacterium]|nr:Rrf2 family transcriptional regulator [Clostridia bacterium]